MLNVVVKTQPAAVILLIEDDRAIARMYQLSLRDHGYQVRVARDGEAGLAAIRSIRPDLVLLDVRLPKLDGIQVLERLQGDRDLRHTKVVMLSNQGMDETVKTSLRLGALDYVTKATVTPRELAQLIARHLLRD
jgi:two-component system, OmpR family, alkaline phosphatase synthesis response regulator PhoP